MSLMTLSATGFVASVFCLIVVPLKGYDDPEILPSKLARFSLIGADAGQFLAIGDFALVQMLVHFRFFLHIGFRQKREDLQLLLFSALLLTIVVAGTIWIMASLAQRMTILS